MLREDDPRVATFFQELEGAHKRSKFNKPQAHVFERCVYHALQSVHSTHVILLESCCRRTAAMSKICIFGQVLEASYDGKGWETCFEKHVKARAFIKKSFGVEACVGIM
jgi:hypothetical protein